MDKQPQLDQIADDIVSNDVCPDLAKSATQLVFGVGNPDAEIVFIGEAPGKKEDEQGEPFVGAAGKFLNEMLESIGLERKDIYITNIVKYRPPENRDPLPDEKTAFLPFLLRQLEVIDPKLIVTLGRHSMEYFLPGKKISQIHGEPKRIKVVVGKKENGKGGDETRSTEQEVRSKNSEKEGAFWVILPLYHPAAALYNGGQRQTLLDDFAKIPKTLGLIGRENQEKTKEQEAK